MLLIEHHVVAQVIKAEFIICTIRNIAGISFLFISMVHAVQVHPNRHPQEVINLSHLRTVALSQIVIDCYDMHAFAKQCIQVDRQSTYQRLTFTCLHLRDTALMQRHASNQLNVKMPHAQRPFGSFAYGCKCLRKKLFQGFALLNPGTEFNSLSF
ncbi:hypothetical protein D3C76_752750 [compost metagenome]